MNLHVRMLSGRNPHHIVEATFKALARALDAGDAARPARRRRAVDEGHARGMSASARDRRLRHGQPAQRAEGVRARRASAARGDAATPSASPTRAGGRAARAWARSAPAWRISRARGLVEPVARGGRARAGRSSASASACSSSSRRARSSGRCAGSACFRGRVVRFPRDPALKVPHMGWNQLRVAQPRAAARGHRVGAAIRSRRRRGTRHNHRHSKSSPPDGNTAARTENRWDYYPQWPTRAGWVHLRGTSLEVEIDGAWHGTAGGSNRQSVQRTPAPVLTTELSCAANRTRLSPLTLVSCTEVSERSAPGCLNVQDALRRGLDSFGAGSSTREPRPVAPCSLSDPSNAPNPISPQSGATTLLEDQP